MKIAYVAGPYRGKSKIKFLNRLQVIMNILRARAVAKRLWQMEFAVICPHSNTALFDGVAPDQAFLDGDIDILKKCDLVVLVEGWLFSSGTKNEIHVAQQHGIPVYIWDYKNDCFGDMVGERW